ncbi:MAG: protoheme IX farnesyltransferase [Chlorobi bacterium]|nr:protoheme IX farnesyltransferase [Chlorobiota bacterium]
MSIDAMPVTPTSAQQLILPRSLWLRAVVELSKPGITLMEVVTAAVGFLVAKPWEHYGAWEMVLRFAGLTVGVLALGASAGAFNHLLERTTDAVMQRTSLRPLPSGKITPHVAGIFATLAFVVGAGVLTMLDILVAVLGIATVVLYVVVYTPLKTRTSVALFVGGVPGALPVVGGWVAGGGSFVSADAAILGAIMFWWQLPHFLALAIMYADDYRRGGIVLLAGGRVRPLAWHTLGYSVLLVASSIAWFVLGRAGTLYFVGAAILSVWLLVRCVHLVRVPNSANARRVLMTTYIFLMGLFLLAAVDVL